MPIAILCPECRKPLGVPDDALDKSIRCPLCQTTFDGRDAPVQRFAIPTLLPDTGRQELPEPSQQAITSESELVPISVAEEDEEPPCVIPVAAPARGPERRPPERRERAPVKRRTPGHPWYLFLFAFLPLGMVLVTLGGAWEDQDGDGIQDFDEQGLADATVRLHAADGIVLGYSITDADGQYRFEFILPGDYFLVFHKPVGLEDSYDFSPQDEGGDDTVDSDVDPDGVTALFALLAGQTETDIDAGLVLLGQG